MRHPHLIVPLALLAAISPRDAAATFCRTSSCMGKEGQVCTPMQPGDCGVPVYHLKPRVTYSIQKDASKQVSFSTMEETMRQAFQTWMSVDCGGGKPPRLDVVEGDPAICALHEFNQDRGNANIIVFRDEAWPHDHHEFALTTVTFGAETGEIYDVDMEINSADWSFTTGDTNVDIDLLSIVTHESGHFLGLAHSPDPGTTMFAYYGAGMTDQRSLEEQDREGICAIYPPGPISDNCDGTPRHGFSPLCGADQPGPVDTTPAPAAGDPASCCCPEGDRCVTNTCEPAGCCSVAPGSGGEGRGPAVMAALALGVLALARRRPTPRGPRGARRGPRFRRS